MIRSTGSGGGGGCFSIAAHTRKLEVDNRISLRYYFRIADSLLRQADIYREEKNVIDLYILLLRFSSLITETIPKHKDYRTSHPLDKNTFRKKLLNVLTELEALKPDVQIRLLELNRKSRNQFQMQHQADLQDNPFEWPPTRKQNSLKYENRQLQVSQSFRRESSDIAPQGPQTFNTSLHPKTIDGQFRKFSFNIPRPKEETLSRHSILGPNGLYGKWQPPRVDRGVQYPSNLDLSPIEISCVEQSNKDKSEGEKNTELSATSDSILESVLSLQVDPQPLVKEPNLGTSADVTGTPAQLDIVRQPSPPPVLADVQDLAADSCCQAADSLLEHELLRSEAPLEVHISTTMMENFMRLAKSNTEKNLETCGVLAGSLKNRNFFVTALIIPKQESTSDSCQATNEEELFDYQDKQSLFTLGWIHTHPTQSCFMSSIDVHTHYSYQIMLPEAIAIVMAPRDSSRKHGIFRLTAPGGMNIIRHCQLRGFHPHDPPADGSPIYDHCTDVYMNSNLKFDVVDLR